MSDARKTDPELWETVVEELKESDKGGEPGRWSARKAQLAVQEYKRRGGGYAEDGPDREETDLHEWTDEDWGTRSGEPSEESGERYLPRRVRMLLTEAEYRRTSEAKRADSHRGDERYSDQPDDVRDKVAHIKENGPTLEMLEERARDLDIDGRSSMNKDELLAAIDEATDEKGRGRGSRAALERHTREELYERAKEADIEGRSTLDKDGLIDALAERNDG